MHHAVFGKGLLNQRRGCRSGIRNNTLRAQTRRLDKFSSSQYRIRTPPSQNGFLDVLAQYNVFLWSVVQWWRS